MCLSFSLILSTLLESCFKIVIPRYNTDLESLSKQMNNLNLHQTTKLYFQWPSTVHYIYTKLVAFASSIH